jgi:hypothetical protein
MHHAWNVSDLVTTDIENKINNWNIYAEGAHGYTEGHYLDANDVFR